MFQLMFVHYTLSLVWVADGPPFGKSCPLGWPYVLILFCQSVFLFISHFGFKTGIWLLIAPVPVHCFSITLTQL